MHTDKAGQGSRVGRFDVCTTEGVGRVELWRRMLESEPRTEVLSKIVAENQGVLDQGLVLPCPPSNEEKVRARCEL